MVRESTGEGYSEAYAVALAALMGPGDVLALGGPLGAGKTTLTRALAGALGVRGVSSPTFVLVNVYDVPAGAGALAGGVLVHVDAYRLSEGDELGSLGWDRLFDGRGTPRGRAAAIIEWPDRLGAMLTADAARLGIEPTGEKARRLTLDAPGSWRARPGFAAFESREPRTCPKTGVWVAPTAATYPFASERARLADLHGWIAGAYSTSRPPDGGSAARGDGTGA